jgi:hypothetical protein
MPGGEPMASLARRFQNLVPDGYERTSPVMAFPAAARGSTTLSATCGNGPPIAHQPSTNLMQPRRRVTFCSRVATRLVFCWASMKRGRLPELHSRLWPATKWRLSESEW